MTKESLWSLAKMLDQGYNTENTEVRLETEGERSHGPIEEKLLQGKGRPGVPGPDGRNKLRTIVGDFETLKEFLWDCMQSVKDKSQVSG